MRVCGGDGVGGGVGLGFACVDKPDFEFAVGVEFGYGWGAV